MEKFFYLPKVSQTRGFEKLMAYLTQHLGSNNLKWPLKWILKWGKIHHVNYKNKQRSEIEISRVKWKQIFEILFFDFREIFSYFMMKILFCPLFPLYDDDCAFMLTAIEIIKYYVFHIFRSTFNNF